MSRPWMPLYVADYLADTGHLSTLEHGAYMLLIMHYWSKGGLPDDDKRLASIARASLEQWADMRSTIAEFFSDGWKHSRIDEELENAAKAYAKRAAAGRAGGKAKAESKQRPSNAITLPEQSHSQPQKEEDATASSKRERDAQFEDLYAAYPRKTGKGEARAKFDKALKAAGFPALLAGVRRYAADREGEDQQFTMQMSRWFHGQHWTDEPAQRQRPRAGPPKPMSLGEMFREDARQNGILNDQPPANPPGRMEARNGDGEVAGAGDPRVIALTRNVLGGFR